MCGNGLRRLACWVAGVGLCRRVVFPDNVADERCRRFVERCEPFRVGYGADESAKLPVHASMAAISGLMPMMFMTRVRL